MDNEAKNPWNSLEIAKLIVGLLTPLFVFVLGYQVNSSFRAADTRRAEALEQNQKLQRELEESKQLAQTRQAAVANFSRFIYERRVRSELLHSALRRHAESPTEDSRRELLERKRLYDEAYVNWNASHQANLLLVRQILGSASYSSFEGMVESRLVSQTFSPLDQCLTQAYDLAIRGEDPRPILKACEAKALIQRSLDCGYAITDELFKISGSSERTEGSVSTLDSRCPV
jgi:hypothetical protein